MATGDGLISITPTSIAYSGTSASINADGGVDFSAVTSLSLNGVFTSDYDNYFIVMSGTSDGGGTIYLRFRAVGSDNSTANSYVYERFGVTSTTINGYRATDNQTEFFSTASSGNVTSYNAFLYGPYLAQPTAFRTVGVFNTSTSVIYEFAGTHNQSVAYDGITLTHNASTWSGNIHVFGYEE
jgi:hypothetical protein